MLPATTNRTCRLANLCDAQKVRGLVWENLAGLKTILRWNAEHGIPLFRMGQSLIPFSSHPEFPYDWVGEHGDELHLSSQDPEKQTGAHAYSVDLADWEALVDALGGREADVMVEAKGKEQALVPLGIKF